MKRIITILLALQTDWDSCRQCDHRMYLSAADEVDQYRDLGNMVNCSAGHRAYSNSGCNGEGCPALLSGHAIIHHGCK